MVIFFVLQHLNAPEGGIANHEAPYGIPNRGNDQYIGDTGKGIESICNNDENSQASKDISSNTDWESEEAVFNAAYEKLVEVIVFFMLHFIFTNKY